MNKCRNGLFPKAFHLFYFSFLLSKTNFNEKNRENTIIINYFEKYVETVVEF